MGMDIVQCGKVLRIHETFLQAIYAAMGGAHVQLLGTASLVISLLASTCLI